MIHSQDSVLKFVVSPQNIHPKIAKIILFGSRARGDSHERSDYDLAVVAPTMTSEEWASWALNIREKVPTLRGVDLILSNEDTSESLKSAIAKDGKVIYERK